MFSEQISMLDYQVVYEGTVLNCVAIRNMLPVVKEAPKENEPLHIVPERIMAVVINENSRIEVIDDIAQKFRFIRK